MTAWCRFTLSGDDAVRFGALEADQVVEYAGDLFREPSPTGRRYRRDDVVLKAPFVPNHIIGIGKNFSAPDDDRPPMPDLPLLFMKPTTSAIGPGEALLLPPGSDRVLIEAEIAVVIGKSGKRLTPEEAESHIFGYTVANDASCPEYYHPEGHWTIGKSFDTFCPLGPVVQTDFDWRNARIRSWVNGEPRQDAPSALMIMPIPEMVAWISKFMTLQPGDVILTGTPRGAPAIGAGDRVVCVVDGIGELENVVRAE